MQLRLVRWAVDANLSFLRCCQRGGRNSVHFGDRIWVRIPLIFTSFRKSHRIPETQSRYCIFTPVRKPIPEPSEKSHPATPTDNEHVVEPAQNTEKSHDSLSTTTPSSHPSLGKNCYCIDTPCQKPAPGTPFCCKRKACCLSMTAKSGSCGKSAS